MNLKRATFLLSILTLSSCGAIRKTPKTEFNDGYYTQTIQGRRQQVYIDIQEDLLKIHQLRKDNNLVSVDTNSLEAYPKERNVGNSKVAVFKKNSFDVDFLTMPLRYRPSQNGVPPQLNTTLNGSAYFGYRTDKYIVNYIASPLKKSERVINHYGFSVGLFGGLGNSAITPTTTNNYLTIEYDGVAFTKGVAGIIAVNNFTVGLAVGFDNLLDSNGKHWIYESQPWVGLAFGLNLN
jgi:hypothetical protein